MNKTSLKGILENEKDIKTLTLSELYGILLNREQQKKLKKNLIRDTKESKSTSLALVSDSVPPASAPSSSVTITELESSNSDISESDPDFNEPLAFLTRTFKRYKKNQFAPPTTISSSKTPKYQKQKERYKKMKSQLKGKVLIVEDCDWDDVSSDESYDEEDTQVLLMAIIDEPTLALMAKIEEVLEEAPAKAPEASTSVTESSSQVSPTYVPLKSLTQQDLLTLDMYNALNGKTSAEKMNVDLRDELKESIAAKEKALAELNAEKVTIKGWSNASEKVDEIHSVGRNVKNKKGLGFTSACLKPDRSMLKFGMFISTIPYPNDPDNLSSPANSHTEGAHKSENKSVKGKAKTVIPSKIKTLKPKKNKVSGGGPLVSGTKSFSQNPTPRLKVDLKSKTKEKKPIPPLSDAKGVLGFGPADMKFK
ncbi:hypothetical protein OSB04_031782 [Centaurea solstitialis]|uniref:Uncharacterized protein n=1 Tax=Centaurea solstitialis TaxID=347529 RepID=A0AA38SBE5_9ASTR|nr:hypothetical protein OSB04_031782 [Centaurea solstitialis]